VDHGRPFVQGMALRPGADRCVVGAGRAGSAPAGLWPVGLLGLAGSSGPAAASPVVRPSGLAVGQRAGLGPTGRRGPAGRSCRFGPPGTPMARPRARRPTVARRRRRFRARPPRRRRR